MSSSLSVVLALLLPMFELLVLVEFVAELVAVLVIELLVELDVDK